MEKNESVEILIFYKDPSSCRLMIVLKNVEKCLEIINIYQNSHLYYSNKALERLKAEVSHVVPYAFQGEIKSVRSGVNSNRKNFF